MAASRSAVLLAGCFVAPKRAFGLEAKVAHRLARGSDHLEKPGGAGDSATIHYQMNCSKPGADFGEVEIGIADAAGLTVVLLPSSLASRFVLSYWHL